MPLHSNRGWSGLTGTVLRFTGATMYLRRFAHGHRPGRPQRKYRKCIWVRTGRSIPTGDIPKLAEGTRVVILLQMQANLV
jgi:hypothetical protein